MPNRAQPSDILHSSYTKYGSRWTCSGNEVRIRKVVHWADPTKILADTRHSGVAPPPPWLPIETKKVRDVVVYERDNTVRTVPVVHVRIADGPPVFEKIARLPRAPDAKKNASFAGGEDLPPLQVQHVYVSDLSRVLGEGRA